ncbi:flagellar hook-length control protein FliK, partial [Ramlibacter sp. MAHUQ-53]|uniref:flagellar hook-length control protein FliK n=1 Tax=unclassified Ramlibacter TaxID=2617605 RepID=UPI00362C16DC
AGTPAGSFAQALPTVAEARGPPGPGAAGRTEAATGALPDPAALLAPSPAPLQAEAPLHQAEMVHPPHEAAFAGELAAQVEVMLQDGIQQAELQLNPVDLGSIRIALRVDGSVADVQFTAVHAATREGIAQGLEQLREMLAGQGLSLGQAEVGARQGGQDGGREPSAPGRPGRPGGEPAGAAAVPVAAPRGRAARGLLDLYA